MTKKALVLQGGSYHDFDGFAAEMQKLLPPLGWAVLPTYDMDQLLTLEEENIDLVISYTCFSSNPDPLHSMGEGQLTDAQADALVNWVQAGGRFFPTHAATSSGKTKVTYTALCGGKFVEHPAQFSFMVTPMKSPHPITEGIEAFSVHDEFYMQTYSDDLHVHMVALDRGQAYPMLWSRTESKGKVVYVAMGHGPLVWNLPQYQQLMRNAVNWVMAE